MEILLDVLGVKLMQAEDWFLCERDGEVLGEGDNPLELCSAFCSALEFKLRRSFRAWCEEHGRSPYSGEIVMSAEELIKSYPEYQGLLDRAKRLITSGEKTAESLFTADTHKWIERKIAPEKQRDAWSRFVLFAKCQEEKRHEVFGTQEPVPGIPPHDRPG